MQELKIIKNDGFDFYVLGCCYTPKDLVPVIKSRIVEIKNKFGYKSDYEIKWSKINGKNLKLVEDIITFVATDPNIFIKVWIVPNKTEKDYKFILKHEHLYNVMYRLMLKNIFEMPAFDSMAKCYLNFDIRNTKSESNAKSISDYLELNFSSKINTSVVSSQNEELVQIADLFTGAVSYERSRYSTSQNKLEVIDLIKKEFGLISLNRKTAKSSMKYNCFIWDGRHGTK